MRPSQIHRKEAAGRRGRVRQATPSLGLVDAASDISLERQVYELLKRGIMSGVFAPGASLTSRSVADSLGVSASPVRDAMKRLEGDGVLKSREKSAYFLTELDRSDYEDIIALRLRLEGYATAEAAKVMDDATVAQLRQLNRDYTANVRMASESLKLNFAFHFGIYRLAGSPVLIELIENLWLRIGPLLQFHAEDGDFTELTANHERIIDALAARNDRMAERALRRDLTDAARVIMPRLKADRRSPDPSANRLPNAA